MDKQSRVEKEKLRGQSWGALQLVRLYPSEKVTLEQRLVVRSHSAGQISTARAFRQGNC